VAELSRNSGRNFSSEIDAGLGKISALVNGAPASGEAMWMAAGLAIIALAFAVTRAVEEL
jgi:hypothetical protein